MKYAQLPLLGATLLVCPTLWAAESTLIAGTIACQNLDKAKAYADYAMKAPDFAADLLDRAACYKVNEATAAIPQGRVEQGFQAYKLLSGHRVWVPVSR